MGESSARKEARRGRRFSPNGPNEWIMGSFSSSLSESSGLPRSLSWEFWRSALVRRALWEESPMTVLWRFRGDGSSSYTTTAARARGGVKRGEDGGTTRCTAGDGETGDAKRGLSAKGLFCNTRLFWVGVGSSQVCSESVDGQSLLSGSLRGHCTRTRASCTSIMMSASLISDVNVFPLARSYFFPWQ